MTESKGSNLRRDLIDELAKVLVGEGRPLGNVDAEATLDAVLGALTARADETVIVPLFDGSDYAAAVRHVPCEDIIAVLRDEAPRTHTRQFCARCNSVDRVGFLAPKELWRLVAGPRWEHDILCLACFAEIGDEKGIRWDLFELEFYPVSYVTLQANRVFDGGSET